MGVVYLAREIRLDRFVVLKTLPRVSNADVSHLNTEARAMAALQHENLAVIFGAERWRDRPVLIMAAETRTIHTLVVWVRTGTDPWSPQTLATHAQMVVGTPAYLCPEAIAMKPADARFDL